MGQISTYAEDEFRFAGLLSGNDNMEEEIVKNLRDLIKVFESQEHSGGSAYMVLTLFDRLIRYKPLSPLTGADDEWVDVSEGMGGHQVWQNKRCFSVFKDAERGAYDIDMAPVFVMPDGTSFTRGGDAKPVNFPYSPGIPEVVQVLNEEDAESYPWAMRR